MLSMEGLRKNFVDFGVDVVDFVGLWFPPNFLFPINNLSFCTELVCISSF